jgi:tRNA (mo5U34)-methyltransferase
VAKYEEAAEEEVSMSRVFTPDELRAEVARLGPWFHAIDLGHDICTKKESLFGEPVDNPAPAWRVIATCLSENLSGLSLLDVGCNGGFYAVQAKRRQASRVLAVDASRRHVQQAQLVRDALDLDIEVMRRSVYDLDPDDVGRFDVTLALGLIYHCKHPILALERLFSVTKTTLVMESAILPPGSDASLSLPLGGQQSTLHAVAFVDNPPESNEAVQNWFVPSAAALEAMLRLVGFPDVRRVSLTTARVVLVATKPDAPAAAFASRLTILEIPNSVKPGATVVLRVKVENRGSAVWPAVAALPPAGEIRPRGYGEVHLVAHLIALDREETVLDWDWQRTALPHDIGPGQDAVIDMNVKAPGQPGTYAFDLDMVAEHIAWFEDLGSRPVRHVFICQ